MKRRVILILLIVAFVWYINSHAQEVHKLIDAFAQGSYLWLFVAAITQIIYFSVFTLMTQSAFRTVQIKRNLLELYPLVFGALFINVLAPSAGLSGNILYADDANKRNEAPSKVIIGSLIGTICNYIAVSIILIFALIFLRKVGLLNNYEIAGSLLFVLPTILPGLLIFMSYKSNKKTEKLLSYLYNASIKISKLIRKPIKPELGWARRIAGELSEAAISVSENKKALGKTLALAFLANIVSIVSLHFIFISFDFHIRYGALIAGYVLGEVVRVISPHPEGVGVVEVAMALIFISFGVPPIEATAISIVFRGLNFWAPLALGFFFLKQLKSFSSES